MNVIVVLLLCVNAMAINEARVNAPLASNFSLKFQPLNTSCKRREEQFWINEALHNYPPQFSCP